MSRLYKHKPGPQRPTPAIWIVVADAGRARIFAAQHTDGELEEVLDLVNPDARLQDHEALSDRQGHMTMSTGRAGNAFEPRQSHAQHVAERFAKTVCERLNAARNDGATDKVYLLAEPGFLGLLRANLDSATRRLIAQELGTDVTKRDGGDIRKLLPAHL